MQQTAIKIFVLLLNCLVVFGLSFFKPDVDLNQVSLLFNCYHLFVSNNYTCTLFKLYNVNAMY